MVKKNEGRVQRSFTISITDIHSDRFKCTHFSVWCSICIMFIVYSLLWTICLSRVGMKTMLVLWIANKSSTNQLCDYSNLWCSKGQTSYCPFKLAMPCLAYIVSYSILSHPKFNWETCTEKSRSQPKLMPLIQPLSSQHTPCFKLDLHSTCVN